MVTGRVGQSCAGAGVIAAKSAATAAMILMLGMATLPGRPNATPQQE
jgi:hypothetical protein